MVKEIVDVVEFLKDYIEQTKETIQIVKTFDSEVPNHIRFKEGFLEGLERQLADSRKALKTIVDGRKQTR